MLAPVVEVLAYRMLLAPLLESDFARSAFYVAIDPNSEGIRTILVSIEPPSETCERVFSPLAAVKEIWLLVSLGPEGLMILGEINDDGLHVTFKVNNRGIVTTGDVGNDVSQGHRPFTNALP